MSNFQGSLPIADGEAIQPRSGRAGATDPAFAAPTSTLKGDSRTDCGGDLAVSWDAGQDIVPDGHLLASRPATPQGRRSLFRR